MNRLGFALLLGGLSSVGCSGEDPPANADATDTGSAETAVDTGTLVVPDTGAPTDTATDVPVSDCLKEIPASYDSPDYATNAATELSFRTKLTALMDPMKAAEADVTKMPTAASLKMLFADGTPSLKSIETTYFATRTEAVIDQFVAATNPAWTPTDPPVGNGGKYGSWIFTQYGICGRQRIEKGAFAGAFYNYGRTLTEKKDTVTEKTIDQLVALYGAHPSFPQDDKAMMNPDMWVARYAKARDDKMQPTGYYRSVKASLIKAKAAAKTKCSKELDDALSAFFLDWEKVEMATVVFYLNDAAVKLTKSPATPADQASGLHGYGELVSFIDGFRTIKDKKITDAQIDELLTLLGSPAEGNATAYKLVTATATEVPKFTAAATKIKAVYGFTDAEMTAFKTNF